MRYIQDSVSVLVHQYSLLSSTFAESTHVFAINWCASCVRVYAPTVSASIKLKQFVWFVQKNYNYSLRTALKGENMEKEDTMFWKQRNSCFEYYLDIPMFHNFCRHSIESVLLLMWMNFTMKSFTIFVIPQNSFGSISAHSTLEQPELMFYNFLFFLLQVSSLTNFVAIMWVERLVVSTAMYNWFHLFSRSYRDEVLNHWFQWELKWSNNNNEGIVHTERVHLEFSQLRITLLSLHHTTSSKAWISKHASAKIVDFTKSTHGQQFRYRKINICSTICITFRSFDIFIQSAVSIDWPLQFRFSH